jgi:hypothetical protein
VSSPYAPPPTETPTALPPNRAPARSGGRAVVLWIVLVIVMYGIYQVFATGPRPARSADPPLAATHPLAWLLPAVVYAGMLAALVVLRSRLPARYRTGELREIVPPAPAAPDAVPEPIDLRLTGTDGSRPVELHVDDRGLHWHAEKRLLQPAHELHIGWDELESLAPFRTWSPLGTWGLVLVLCAAIWTTSDLMLAAGSGAIGAVLILIGRTRTRGGVALTTRTHALRFHSRALDKETADRLLIATRARQPRAAPAPRADSPGAVRALFLQPFADLALSTRNTPMLRSHMRALGATFADEDTAVAAVVQLRMYGVWSGGLRGVGPLAVLAAGVIAAGPGAGLVAAVLAWVLGLVVAIRASTLFARFSGMSVVKPAP